MGSFYDKLSNAVDHFLQRDILIHAGCWDARPDIGDMGTRHILARLLQARDTIKEIIF